MEVLALAAGTPGVVGADRQRRGSAEARAFAQNDRADAVQEPRAELEGAGTTLATGTPDSARSVSQFLSGTATVVPRWVTAGSSRTWMRLPGWRIR